MLTGRMMDFPLSLPHLYERARTLFPKREIVCALPDKSRSRSTYADLTARIFRTSFKLSRESVRLTHAMSDMDSAKARRELGWEPRPTEESIRDAIRFFKETNA